MHDGTGRSLGCAVRRRNSHACSRLIFTRWFRLKEKKLELEANRAAEKAAQYAASNAELEARVRVLEKIVTDGGVQTAAQIEALRDRPRLEDGDKVQ